MRMSCRALPLILAGLALAWPARAEACGGFFCDAGPQPMAVDQTGENILFVLADGFVETHIQIEYDPNSEAQAFAWVVPVTALPSFEVGSGPLFDAVMDASVPTFGIVNGDSCGGGGTDSGGAFISEPDAGATGDPDVVLEETVGAFDVVVLDGGTVDGVMQWLGDNGYQQDQAAAPILAEYLAEGFLFAAFKLSNGADVSEVHPVVLRIPGDQPCVPLRLTRIAAQPDMDVRVMLLGEGRMVPTNYRHVIPNPVALDWSLTGQNYRDLVRRAIDEGDPDGHAFVTEYAGPTELIDTTGVLGAAWDATAYASIEAAEVTAVLESQGLALCAQGMGCSFAHPLVLGLLRKYVPTPAGLTEDEFYGCLSCNEAMIDQQIWDAAAFSQDFSDRVIDPGVNGVDVLMTHPYLTRMYTRISPEEMTVDPMFHAHPSARPPDVGNIQNATLDLPCDVSGRVYRLPDEREVFVPPGAWPEIAGMPAFEDVEQFPYVGPPQSVMDETKLIDELLADWNAMHGWPPGGGDDGGDDGGGDGGAESSGTGSDSGGLLDAAPVASCACRAGDDGPATPWLWAVLPGLWYGRRRPERRP